MLTKEGMYQWLQTAPQQRLGNALVSLYDRQTEDEKDARETKHNNGIGFNGVDANVLTGISKWFKDKGFLTPAQTKLVRFKISKYSGQLADIANQRNAAKGDNNGTRR